MPVRTEEQIWAFERGLGPRVQRELLRAQSYRWERVDLVGGQFFRH